MTKKTVFTGRVRGCDLACAHCKKCEGRKCPHEIIGMSFQTDNLEHIRQNGIKGYDLVLFIDIQTQHAVILSNKIGISLEELQKDGLIHKQAWEETATKGIFHYEWSFDKDNKRCFFQTVCVGIYNDAGTISGLFSLTRDISNWGQISPLAKNRTLREISAPRTFSQILLSARETEKKEIAKALHDEIGSTAVILTTLLSIVKASVKEGDQEQALADIAKLDEQIKDSIERVKNIVVSLRPPSLENDGALGGAIQELLENISSLVHIPYEFEYQNNTGKNGVSDNIKILLYRIVQEAINNIVKHAKAKHIFVSLKANREQINLIVQDDGVGFKMPKQRSIRKVGLLAMKDSVGFLGGTISIKSTLGKGTRIEVVCPRVVYGGK